MSHGSGEERPSKIRLDTEASMIVCALYRNHRGEVSLRRLTPHQFTFGQTEYHKTLQWLLHAFDEDKKAWRTFALKDFLEPLVPESEYKPTTSQRVKVTLCGSTRFKEAFIAANYRETMAGKIVLSVGWFSHTDRDVFYPSDEQKRDLDRLHFDKIDESDEILVIDCLRWVCPSCTEWYDDIPTASYCLKCKCKINPIHYIGESTRNEINHALRTGKRVRYLSQESRTVGELCNG